MSWLSPGSLPSPACINLNLGLGSHTSCMSSGPFLAQKLPGWWFSLFFILRSDPSWLSKGQFLGPVMALGLSDRSWPKWNCSPWPFYYSQGHSFFSYPEDTILLFLCKSYLQGYDRLSILASQTLKQVEKHQNIGIHKSFCLRAWLGGSTVISPNEQLSDCSQFYHQRSLLSVSSWKEVEFHFLSPCNVTSHCGFWQSLNLTQMSFPPVSAPDSIIQLY